jgi:hypothetical protein
MHAYTYDSLFVGATLLSKGHTIRTRWTRVVRDSRHLAQSLILNSHGMKSHSWSVLTQGVDRQGRPPQLAAGVQDLRQSTPPPLEPQVSRQCCQHVTSDLHGSQACMHREPGHIQPCTRSPLQPLPRVEHDSWKAG